MKKRGMLILLTVLVCCLLLTACGGPALGTTEPRRTELKTEDLTEDPTPTPAEPVPMAAILNREGSPLGEIDALAVCTAADAGILYSVFQPAEYQYTATAEYHFFRAADGQDLLLGCLENQGYEAVYARTELEGRVYTLAVTGNPVDEEPDPLWLLALDPEAGTLSSCELTADGFPYASMAAVGGRLLILNHETHAPRSDKIYEFDPGTGAVRELLAFPDDGTASLRGICAAEEGFGLLRLRLEQGSPAELLLERRDPEGRLLSERSLNELLIPAAQELPGFQSKAELLNEFGLMVSGFALLEGRYLYYETFGTLRAVLDLERGEALLTKDDLWSVSLGSGSPALFRLDFEEAPEGPEILTLRDGALERMPFAPGDPCWMLRAVSHSPGGCWLAELADSAKAFEAKRLLYFWQEP